MKATPILSTMALLLSAASFAQTPPDAKLKMNQIQVIGTHNSYHAGFAPSAEKLAQQINPKGYMGLEYKHLPLAEQLDAGVRQIELDLFVDSKGGRYAHPGGLVVLAKSGLPADPPFDPYGVMLKPGFKVLHMQDEDFRSACQPFVECLREVKTWSDAHPDHVPVYILLETKSDKPGEKHATPAEPWTAASFDALDAEIRSVFSGKEMVTPDDVRGSYETLNAAVLAGNWPRLSRVLGKVVFLMDQRWAGPIYLEGHPVLQNRVIFTNADPGKPDAAFVERNDGPASEITALVKKGYLVRTRADADTKEARTNSTARRDAMIASGAQMISTDYPANEPAKWDGLYSVKLSGREFQCDAVNAACGGK